MKKHNHQSGFTIIEVVLVLAISGLIFLMVFVALPSLQRAQRDRQRTNDISEILAAMENYRSRNGGRLPGTLKSGRNKGRACFAQSQSGCNTLEDLNEFLEKYITDDVVDPSSGKKYHFAAAGFSGSSCKEQYGKIQRGGNLFNAYGYAGLVACYETKCDGAFSNAENVNHITIYFNLESGGAVCREI